MEELSLHNEGENQYLRAIKTKFDGLKQRIINSSDLTENEKETQLSRAKTSFLEEKKEARYKLF